MTTTRPPGVTAAAPASEAWFAIVGLRLLLWLGVAAWWLWPWLSDPWKVGVSQDAAYFLHHAEAAWRTWVQYRELPVWEPWFCGGIPGLGNIQNNAISPTFALTFSFGLMPGIRLGWLLYVVAGMEGSYQYARHFGVRGAGAVLAGVVFALSGRFAQSFYDGQPVFLGFELAPWVLLGQVAGLHSWRAAAGGAVAMAIVFLEGGAVATPLLGLALAVGMIGHTVDALVRRNVAWWRPLGVLVFMALVTAGLSALRLLPVAETVLTRPRLWEGRESYDIAHLWAMLFEPSTLGGYEGPGTSYIGVLTAVACLTALVRADGPAWRLAAWAGALGWLAMGSQKFGAWDALQYLPVLKNLRCPFRLTFLLGLFTAIGAGRALWLCERDLRDRLQAPLSLRAWRRLRVPSQGARAIAAGAAATVAVGLGFVVARQSAQFNAARVAAVPTKATSRWADQPFRQSLGNRWHAHVWPAVHLGSLGCFEEQPFPTSPALRADLAAEEYLADADAGHVERRSWSPHRIELAVDLKRPATLIVNQNDHRGWGSDVGAKVKHQGLLAVQLPAGRRIVTLRHRDPLVFAGLGITALTTLGLLAWPLRGRRRRDPVPAAVPGDA